MVGWVNCRYHPAAGLAADASELGLFGLFFLMIGATAGVALRILALGRRSY
jgi:hypothetical protein